MNVDLILFYLLLLLLFINIIISTSLNDNYINNITDKNKNNKNNHNNNLLIKKYQNIFYNSIYNNYIEINDYISLYKDNFNEVEKHIKLLFNNNIKKYKYFISTKDNTWDNSISLM